jgi:hypothetical protein
MIFGPRGFFAQEKRKPAARIAEIKIAATMADRPPLFLFPPIVTDSTRYPLA